MTTLLHLPTEILTNILIHLHPRDIVHHGQTCRQFHNLVKPSNNFLWHAAFLQIFDNPQHAFSLLRTSTKPKDVEEQHLPEFWFHRIKRRSQALKAIDRHAAGPFDQYGLSPGEIVDTLLDLVETAKTGPTEYELSRGIAPMVDDRRSLNLELLANDKNNTWNRLEDLIHESHVEDEEQGSADPDRPVTRTMAAAKRHRLRSEAASKLHVLYGRTIRERLEYGQMAFVRSIVYDWNIPCSANEYGPLKKDYSGNVDWKVLEASASVMLRHFEMGADGQIALPHGFYFALPCRTLIDPNIPQDWAGVGGSWVGTYSFLDYSDLFAYNLGTHNMWELEDVSETHGALMILDLNLDPELTDDPRLQTNLPHSDDLPTVYFSGNSRSFDPYGQPRLLINVIGCAFLCPNGREVRWRFIISYRGQEQWVLEGVQPGGVRSGPVFGLWTQWGHDEHAPVGAFMYVPEKLCKLQALVLAS